eukprot:5431495-Amphidinium_carterae.1
MTGVKCAAGGARGATLSSNGLQDYRRESGQCDCTFSFLGGNARWKPQRALCWMNATLGSTLEELHLEAR